MHLTHKWNFASKEWWALRWSFLERLLQAEQAAGSGPGAAASLCVHLSYLHTTGKVGDTRHCSPEMTSSFGCLSPMALGTDLEHFL